MASISSSVATVSRTAPAQANMVAPFTGLKSNAAFPTTKKANDFSTLPSNGGRVQCMQVWPAYGNKKFETLSYLPPLSTMAPTVMMASSATAVAPFQGLKSTASLPVARRSSRSLGNVSNGGRIRCMQPRTTLYNKVVMRTSIATVCLSGTLAEKLRAAADAGFDGVEIFEQDLVVSPHSAEQIRQRAQDLGLTLDLFQPFRDFEGVEEEQFLKNLHRLEEKFKLMNRLGIEMILLCSNVGTATINDDDLFVEQLHRAADLAEKYNVKIAYEALAWGKFVNDFEHAHALVEKVNHKALGTCLDTFHILSRGWETDEVENIPAEKIFFVQLADAPKLSMDILSWSRHHRVFPGEGDFDLVKFMVHLAKTGYDGPISLEIFNDSFRKAEVGRTAIDGLRSLRWLEDQTWHALNAEDRPSALELRALPEVAEPEGVDFIEIATGRLGETIRVLHQLGFRLGGHHCSKQDYQVWTQGDVRIVVCDRGATGAPTTISAMGFDTPDPEAAHARAELLRAQTIDRPHIEGEVDLKGVYAPDGVELFFAGPSPDGMPEWLPEFGVEKQEAGLIEAIDHVNFAQPWQHFDEAVLFYTALMALETVRETLNPADRRRNGVAMDRLPIFIRSQCKGFASKTTFCRTAADGILATARLRLGPSVDALKSRPVVDPKAVAGTGPRDFELTRTGHLRRREQRRGRSPAVMDVIRRLTAGLLPPCGRASGRDFRPAGRRASMFRPPPAHRLRQSRRPPF